MANEIPYFTIFLGIDDNGDYLAFSSFDNKTGEVIPSDYRSFDKSKHPAALFYQLELAQKIADRIDDGALVVYWGKAKDRKWWKENPQYQLIQENRDYTPSEQSLVDAVEERFSEEEAEDKSLPRLCPAPNKACEAFDALASVYGRVMPPDAKWACDCSHTRIELANGVYAERCSNFIELPNGDHAPLNDETQLLHLLITMRFNQ